jgi:hypothetical protein
MKLFGVLLICGASLYAQSRPTTAPDGFVPDEATAIRIAEAVFIPIYGHKKVRSERPFRARLDGDHWIVSGTLPKSPDPGLIMVGGTMMAEINSRTGAVRAVYHMK